MPHDVNLAGMLGPAELLIILGIVVLLFGARRIPALARGIGEGLRNFREGVRGDGSGEGSNGGSDERLSDRSTDA